MELDLIDVHFDLRDLKPREIEEALEDPFGVRFLPDVDRADGEARFYALGRTIADRYLFLCFRTDGKATRVVVDGLCEPCQALPSKTSAAPSQTSG